MEIEAMENAGIIELLDETFSVNMVKVFKPHTDVYEMVPNMYDVDACHVYFILSKLWAPGAEANFGFRSVGINRLSQRPRIFLGSRAICSRPWKFCLSFWDCRSN